MKNLIKKISNNHVEEKNVNTNLLTVYNVCLNNNNTEVLTKDFVIEKVDSISSDHIKKGHARTIERSKGIAIDLYMQQTIPDMNSKRHEILTHLIFNHFNDGSIKKTFRSGDIVKISNLVEFVKEHEEYEYTFDNPFDCMILSEEYFVLKNK